MMSARAGSIIASVSFLVALCGCGSCREEVHDTVSPDGRTMVRVQWWSGCGGATVNSSTDVFLVRRIGWIPFFERSERIAEIDRSPGVRPTWNSNKIVTIRVTPDNGSYWFEWRKTEALGITVRWTVTEYKGK